MIACVVLAYIAARLVVWLLLFAFTRDTKKELGILFGERQRYVCVSIDNYIL